MAWQDYTQVTVGVKTAGKFDVGSDVVSYLGRTTNLTLPTSVYFKTVVVENTLNTPIDVTLPDATAIPGGVVAVNVLGLYSIGGPVNLRDAGGNLLARFNGSKHSKTTTRPGQEIGARLDLLSIATVAGVWRPRDFYGTNYAPRIKTVETTAAASWSMTAGTGTTFPQGNTSINLASLNLPENEGGTISLDAERKLLLWADAGGTKCRVLKVDATTKAVTLGSISTIVATATGGIPPMAGCVYNVTGGSEYVIVGAEQASNTIKLYCLQITGTSVAAVGSAGTMPTTDSGGNTGIGYNSGIANVWHFIALSTTKILVAFTTYSSASTRDMRYSHVVVSGTTISSVGTPQVLASGMGNSDPSGGGYRFFVCPNTANRVFQPAGNGKDCRVIDTSGANPAIAYEPATYSLPCAFAATGSPVFYDYTDGWIYCNSSIRPTELWRFKCGASAVSNIEFVRDVPYSSFVTGGNMALTGYELTNYVNNTMSTANVFLTFDIDYGGVMLSFVSDNVNTPGPGTARMWDRSFQMFDNKLYGTTAYSANGVYNDSFAMMDGSTRHYGIAEHPGKALGAVNVRGFSPWGLFRMSAANGFFPVVVHRVADSVAGDPGQGADVVTIVYECPRF